MVELVALCAPVVDVQRPYQHLWDGKWENRTSGEMVRWVQFNIRPCGRCIVTQSGSNYLVVCIAANVMVSAGLASNGR